MPSTSSNQINPKKLRLSKWTAVNPQEKEKHFLVTKVIDPEQPKHLVAHVRKPHGIRAGVVGTRDGIRRFKNFVKSLQTPLPIKSQECKRNRPIFPGFEAVFGIKWGENPHLEATIDPQALRLKVNLDDRHQRVFLTVQLRQRFSTCSSLCGGENGS